MAKHLYISRFVALLLACFWVKAIVLRPSFHSSFSLVVGCSWNKHLPAWSWPSVLVFISFLPTHPKEKSFALMRLNLPGRLIEGIRLFTSCLVNTGTKHKIKLILKPDTAGRKKTWVAWLQVLLTFWREQKEEQNWENKPLCPIFHSLY